MQPLLKFNPPPYSVEAQTQLPPVSLKAVFAFLRRNWLVLIASAVLGIGAGVVYLENAQPVYVARTELVVDTRENTALPLQRTTETVANDASSIETQVGLLASENVLMSAIDNEKLLEDPIFTGANDKADTIPIWLANAIDAVMTSGPVQAVTGMFGPIKVDEVISRDSPARNDAEFRRKRLAVERLRSNLSVERRGLTNIIEIRYSSNDARLPARIANAITQAYISDQLNVKFQTSKIATDWLQTRIAELREQNAAASRAVQDFRTRNNLIETSRGRISEQQLGEFNSQLVLARVATSESKARLDRIVEVAASGVPDPTTTEVIKSEIITRLRNQFLDLSQREREIANRLGEDHPVASDIRKQMSEVRRAMSEELSRLIASARSDYEVSLTREKALDEGVASSIKDNVVANQAQVTLRELESSEAAIKAIYEAFLSRYTETIQTQSFPVANARVITEATPPLRHSYPRPKITLAIASILGLFGGLAVCVGRERLRNVFRNPADVRDTIGYELLGWMPRLPRVGDAQRATYAMQHPGSHFAENLRAILISLQVDRSSGKARRIGIVSAREKEGKTQFTANLGALATSMDLRTLVIDGDLKTRKLSQLLGQTTGPGLGDLLSNRNVDLTGAMRQVDGYDFLPAGTGTYKAPSDLLGSAVMSEVLQELESEYDLIVVDLPPTIAAVDARVAVKLIGSALFLIEWNRTAREDALKGIKIIESVGGHIAGCVLTKTRGPGFTDLG